MRTFLQAALPVLSLFAAVPAIAQDVDPTTSNKPDAPAPSENPPAITISGGATVVTDYRFRGLSQTDKDFAIQGTATVAHKSGFYVSVWGSSIDDYVAFGGDAELDLIGGFKKTFSGTTVDVGVLYYYYPGAEKLVKVNTDFFEPYVSVSHTYGPITGKITANYAPKQSALDYGFGKEQGFYLGGDLSGSYMGIGLAGHLGHSFHGDYITAGQKYTDWSLGANYTYKNLLFGVSYVDTDAHRVNSNTGKNIAKGGIVGSVGVSF